MGLNSNLIVFLVVIGITVFGWVARWVEQQRQVREARRRAEARREAALRTGRDEGPAPAGPTRVSVSSEAGSARARLEELARRRQEQLRLLRAQQQASSQASPAARSTPTPRPVTGAGRRASTVRSRPTPQRTQTTPTRSPPRPTVIPSRRAQRPAPMPRLDEVTESTTRSVFADSDATPVAPAPVAARAAPVPPTPLSRLAAGDLARAVILKEILDPPVGLRGPSESWTTL